MDGYCVSCASSPVRTRGITGFYIRSPLTVAVLSSSYGKKKKKESHFPPLCAFATMSYIACASNKTHNGTVIYMPLGSASVPFKDSLSLGTVVTAVQVVSLSAERRGGRERRNRVFRKGAENSGGPLKLRNNI